MARGRDDFLFASLDGMAVRSAQIKAAADEASSLAEERVLNSDLEDLVRYFVAKYNVEVPTIFRDKIVADRSEQNVSVWDRYDQRERIAQGVVFTFELPFEGEEDIFKMVPSTYDSSPPAATVRGRYVVFSVSGREVSSDQIKRAIDETVGSIEKYLKWHRELWNGFEIELSNTVRQSLERRRERLLKQHDVSNSLAALGVTLKEKANDPKTYVAPAIREKIVPTLPPMKPREKADPTLDEAQYQTILKLLKDAGRSVERSSSRARELDEQTLRDILLVPLNAHFEGKATGEAFNFSGKTDILVRHDGGNLFVAECKIWSGEKALHQAIDQLLGYLTWRDTKTALIVFNRNTNFTEVLSKLQNSPTSHANFKRGPTAIDESTFRFTFALPHDAERLVSLTIIGLDLGPSPDSGPRIRQL